MRDPERMQQLRQLAAKRAGVSRNSPTAHEVGRNQMAGGDPRPMAAGHDPGGPGLTEPFHLVKTNAAS